MHITFVYDGGHSVRFYAKQFNTVSSNPAGKGESRHGLNYKIIPTSNYLMEANGRKTGLLMYL